MACNNPLVANFTIADFKTLFSRDFKYLPVWDNATIYNKDEIVYYTTNKLFYKAKNNGVNSIPTTTNDWLLIIDNVNNYILDSDIEKATDEACFVFNATLYPTDKIKLPWLYLIAHFLVLDLRAGGVRSESFALTSSKSVGSVSESYSIPDWILQNPQLAYLSKTSYGSKYLNMTLPYLVGNVGAVYGGTNA
jgi:hypothetical protein